MKNNARDYRKTKIWKHFEEKVTDPSNKQTVEYLVDYAVPILKDINETFPTYTLHDGQHQLNILNLYADLLGERTSELSGLETAILILSAFYHDIGMVYTKQERDNLSNEPLFNDFLQAKPAARLELDKKKKVDDELAEWYCRWAHAKRVWVYLDELNKKFIWDNNNSIGNNFRVELAEVCLSHCEDTDYIKMSDEIVSGYWIDTDLKFCAILLRLADILDFDNTRSPISLYKHLGLDKPTTNSEKISQQEWRKHIASIGFDFRDWSRDNQYILYYKATPDHPAVENDIYEFLDVIENEIRNCKLALNSCSDRWRNFVLPGKIDRKQIRSQGYTSGAFKFSLDQNQILQLLMGESLYDNPYVFIRELVQNAIDTSRHRVKHEKNVLKNDTYTSKPIEFTDWEDEHGYRWIRIDDYGMGMTKDQIEKYFLKVGNSFYNSDDFKISKLDYSAEDKNFTPISRFGIGILSCFMVADEIEVSTKSVYCSDGKDDPIRLSLSGLQNFYLLFTKDNIPKKAMPNKNEEKELYRKETGTSIAIRLKHNFNRDDLDIHNQLESLIYCSEVPVKYESKFYGKEKIENLSGKIKKYKLLPEDVKQIKEFLDDPEIEDLSPEIHRVPLNLAHKLVPDVEGILYVFVLKTNLKFKSSINPHKCLKKQNEIQEKCKLRYNGDEIDVVSSFTLEIFKPGNGLGEILEIHLDKAIKGLKKFDNGLEHNILITHNGIIVPNNYEGEFRVNLEVEELNTECTFTFGVLKLKDEIRPNLNLARNRLTSFSWNFYSIVSFLIRRSINQIKKYNFKFYDLSNDSYENFTNDRQNFISEILNDKLIYDNDGWKQVLKIKKTNLTFATYSNTRIETNVIHYRGFYSTDDWLYNSVLLNNFKYTIRLFKTPAKGKKNQFHLKQKGYIEGERKYEKFPFPFYLACEYEDFEGLMPESMNGDSLFNINHFFTKWLIRTYSELSNNFNHHLQLILEANSMSTLNDVLNKLKKILPEELQPNFTITVKDFEVDFDQLEELPED